MTALITPAKCNLRHMNEGLPKVSKSRTAKFHSIIMLIMLVSHRGRRYLKPDVAFLFQRVNVCTDEDYGKLKRLFRHTIGSMDEIPCVGSTDLSSLLHFLDTACGVHVDD